MKDENDPATSDKKKPTGRKGKAGGASKKTSENDDPANEDLNLSEGEDSADDKQVKKGPTKRSAPSSDKKTGTTNSKKRSAEDGPFEDRTNDNDSAEAEYNSEDGESLHTIFNPLHSSLYRWSTS
jgi:hypothetical protein